MQTYHFRVNQPHRAFETALYYAKKTGKAFCLLYSLPDER